MRIDTLKSFFVFLLAGLLAVPLWAAPPPRKPRAPRIPAEALRNPYDRKQMLEHMKKLVEAFAEDKMPKTLDEYLKAPTETRRTKSKAMNHLLSIRNCMNNPDIQEALGVDKDWHRALYKEAAKFVEAAAALDDAIEKRDAGLYEKAIEMYDDAGKTTIAALKTKGSPMPKNEMEKLRRENIERRRKLYLNSRKQIPARESPSSNKEGDSDRQNAEEK